MAANRRAETGHIAKIERDVAIREKSPKHSVLMGKMANMWHFWAGPKYTILGLESRTALLALPGAPRECQDTSSRRNHEVLIWNEEIVD